jgi:primosomal protein N' (replication factor Y)
MIARVSLEIALRKEFDYSIPPGLVGQVEVGSRVQVPFGPRKIYGCVTALAEESAHANLKPILKVIGAQTMVTPRVLRLARWIADYYCCAPETALKSVLPEAVRKKKETEEGWKRQLTVRALPVIGALPKLAKRQQEVWNLVEERRELPLAELLELAETTAATVRKLEDRGLVEIAQKISERDPYAREHILPSQPLLLNPAQVAALERITAAMDKPPSTLNAQSSTFPPRRHRQRQDRDLSPGPGPRARTRQGRDCARAGNFAHAADRRAVQGALQFRQTPDARRGFAQPFVHRRTPR